MRLVILTTLMVISSLEVIEASGNLMRMSFLKRSSPNQVSMKASPMLASLKASICYTSTQSQPDSVLIGSPYIDGIFQHGLMEPFIARKFLDVVLNLKGGSSIATVTFLPEAPTPSTPLESFDSLPKVNMYCQSREGRKLRVQILNDFRSDYHLFTEVQNDFRSDYHLRAFIEHSQMVSHISLNQPPDFNKPDMNNEAPSKPCWKDVHDLHSIVLTHKTFGKTRKKKTYPKERFMEMDLLTTYELRNVHNLEQHYGDFSNQITLLMLARLQNKPPHLFTPLERWAYLFRNNGLKEGSASIDAVKRMDNVKEFAAGDKAIEKFIHRLNVRRLPLKVLDRYQSALSYYNVSWEDMEESLRHKTASKVNKQSEMNFDSSDALLLSPEELGEPLIEDATMKRFMSNLKTQTLSDELQERYQHTLQYYNDSIVDIAEKGKAEGRKERDIEIAKKMLAKNMDVSLIQELTGLTEQEIKGLKP